MAQTFPIISAPTTQRRGWRSIDIVLSQFDVLPTIEKARKFQIPQVTLDRNEYERDFACLLGHGTVPFEMEEKCIDPFLFAPNSTLSVRFDGQASYSLLAHGVERSELNLYAGLSIDSYLISLNLFPNQVGLNTYTHLALNNNQLSFQTDLPAVFTTLEPNQI